MKRGSHCKQGHALVPGNVYSDGRCRKCTLARVSAQWYAEKAARKEKRAGAPKTRVQLTYGRNWGAGLGSVVDELLAQGGSYE